MEWWVFGPNVFRMDTKEVSHQRRSAHPLRIWRTAKCLSQLDVAQEAGLARTTIIRIEAGEHPTLRTANAIANAIGVDRLALFGPDPEADHGP